MRKIAALAIAILSFSATRATAGLEPSSVSGYSAFTNAVVSLVITDENGYMGVLLTKKADPNDKIWLWNLPDSRCTPDAFKAMLTTALSGLSTGSLMNAIVITAPQHVNFTDSQVKGTRIATNRLSALWVEAQ